MAALLPGVRTHRSPTLGLAMRKVGADQYARVRTWYLYSDTTFKESAVLTFHVRQPVVMEAGYHTCARCILFRLDAEQLQLEDVQPSRYWDPNTEVFIFPTDGTNPTPATFRLQSSSATDFTVNIKVTVDKPWGEMVEMDPGWRTCIERMEVHSLESYRMDCRSSKYRMTIQVIRGLVNQRPSLTLTVLGSWSILR
ncbi:hypothetical protein QBC40DRAFT_301846 [Triangularia verruculosa]|uniref:Uncharacterized protein n=1 Tax=Triangularia verruculosa TaxID=2587418 RepID=A0AAN6X9U6_9PEZI|nr:hypothetical protein QBC40DRAFT_301846 [Triangularia verruculosa]